MRTGSAIEILDRDEARAQLREIDRRLEICASRQPTRLPIMPSHDHRRARSPANRRQSGAGNRQSRDR